MNRTIRVSGEYHFEVVSVTMCIILDRFAAYVGRGTCWSEPGSAASFAPSQMVRMRTFGTCCCSCCVAKHLRAVGMRIKRHLAGTGGRMYLFKHGDDPVRVVA